MSVLLLLLLLVTSCHEASEPDVPQNLADISGYIRDTDGNPFADVVVSDGFTCTKTDGNGYYEFKRRNTNAMYISYSLPAEAEVEIGDNGRPVYWQSIFPKKESYDFTLKRQAREDKFVLFCLGDPQVCVSNRGLERFEAETAPDVKAFAARYNDRNVYSITLGDHVHNEWSSFEDIFALLDAGHLGVPNFPVIGNHDHESKQGDEYQCMKRYMSVAGPVNYSFNRGGCHIAVVDNLKLQEGTTGTFSAEFNAETLQWLKQDLQYVSKDKSVILCMHANQNNTSIPEVYQLLAAFPFARIICGHTHSIYHVINHVNDKAIYVSNIGTTNGVDWAGTVCGDGAPMGYGVYEFEGSTLKNHFYKPVKMDPSFQIRLYRGSSFPSFSHMASDDMLTFDWDRADDGIIANIWNYKKDWKLEVYEDGKLSDHAPVQDNDMYDMWSCTYFYQECDRETTSYCQRRKHLFKYVPDNPSAKILFKAYDEFGNVYEQSEITATTSSAGKYN